MAALRNLAAASLLSYDGSAGVLVDTNIWVDCIDEASPGHDWAIEQLQVCNERSPLHVNLVIYTELLVPDPDVAAARSEVFKSRRSSTAGIVHQAQPREPQHPPARAGRCPVHDRRRPVVKSSRMDLSSVR